MFVQCFSLFFLCWKYWISHKWSNRFKSNVIPNPLFLPLSTANDILDYCLLLKQIADDFPYYFHDVFFFHGCSLCFKTKAIMFFLVLFLYLRYLLPPEYDYFHGFGTSSQCAFWGMISNNFSGTFYFYFFLFLFFFVSPLPIFLN